MYIYISIICNARKYVEDYIEYIKESSDCIYISILCNARKYVEDYLEYIKESSDCISIYIICNYVYDFYDLKDKPKLITEILLSIV